MTDPPDLLRVTDAARLLGVESKTLKQWVRDGKVRGGRTPGGHWRVPRAEVDRLRAGFGIEPDENRSEP
jgi:excisionase family DNA binding protein